MSSSAIQVCNFALSHLGVGKAISSLDESSKEAEACNLFYEPARDEMLSSFVWPFATKNLALGLVSTKGDTAHPTTEWYYSYRYPADALYLQKILSCIRNDNRQSRVPYELAADSTGTLIFTDQQNAVIRYTSTLGQNPARWAPDFAFALSYRIAAYVAPRVTGGDPFKVGQLALQMWKMSLAQARASAANEIQVDEQPDAELIRARY